MLSNTFYGSCLQIACKTYFETDPMIIDIVH